MLRIAIFFVGLAMLSATTLQAADGCCAHCGCGTMRKVCVPVTETVKETTYEYTCVCEDFCVPGPSKCVGHRCEPDCSGCPRCVPVMQPTCGTVHTRTKLVKTPVTRERCVTKWVVKLVCCGCTGTGSCTNASACTTEVPLQHVDGSEPAQVPMPPLPMDVAPPAATEPTAPSLPETSPPAAEPTAAEKTTAKLPSELFRARQ